LKLKMYVPNCSESMHVMGLLHAQSLKLFGGTTQDSNDLRMAWPAPQLEADHAEKLQGSMSLLDGCNANHRKGYRDRTNLQTMRGPKPRHH